MLFASSAIADQIGLTAFVDRNEITLEDSLQLSVTIRGVRNSPNPDLPDLSAFRIQSKGTSSSTSIANGRMTTSKKFRYRLSPQKAGRFIIGPITVKISGKTYTSQAITIQVSEAKLIPEGSEPMVYVESSVSDQTPYLHEQIVYTFKLFRRVNARNFNLSMPYNPSYF